jgi:hypothetical protein
LANHHHRPSSGNGNLLLSRSHGSQGFQADIIDKVEVDEGGFSLFSATKSDVGASDEFAQHESNSSLSDIDLQYTATIHDPERSLQQEEPSSSSKAFKSGFCGGRWG